VREVLKRNSTRVELTEAARIFLLEPEKNVGQCQRPTSGSNKSDSGERELFSQSAFALD
jgi:hypothetical protein